MIPQSLIRITQNRIEKTFSDLQKEIENYESVENKIQINVDRLHNLKRHGRMDIYSPQGIELAAMLNDTNNEMRRVNHRAIREIDSMTAEIAAYISLLIDECMENYSTQLKMWIKTCLLRLDDMRVIKIQGVNNYLIFPVAVGILTPYAIKTRLCDEETSRRLATVRNLIRKLSEPSY